MFFLIWWTWLTRKRTKLERKKKRVNNNVHAGFVQVHNLWFFIDSFSDFHLIIENLPERIDNKKQKDRQWRRKNRASKLIFLLHFFLLYFWFSWNVIFPWLNFCYSKITGVCCTNSFISRNLRILLLPFSMIFFSDSIIRQSGTFIVHYFGNSVFLLQISLTFIYK